MTMKLTYKTPFSTLIAIIISITTPVFSQTDTSGKKFTPHLTLLFNAFGDFAYKAHADTLHGGRGVSQYSGIPGNESLFQFRRLYLGGNYLLNSRFSAELLMAAENNVTGGDLLANNNFSPYIKRANIRWTAWKGTNVLFGLISTPAHTFSSEPLWGYRSIEKTITDTRHTPAIDMGVEIQGHFISSNDNYGYIIMIANGQGSKPENDKYKWLYGDIYAKFLDKKLFIEFYGDYNKLNWTPTWHHARNMYKITAGYTVPKITIGVEAFINKISGDNIAIRANGGKDTIANKSRAISLFAHGPILKNRISFFARYDIFDPSVNNNNSLYKSYAPQTITYDVNAKEEFITAGLDFTPDKYIHIMPNIWYTSYKNTSPQNYGAGNNGYDLVLRLTVFWILTQ